MINFYQKEKSKIKGVIFDLDGVIISSKMAEYESWRRVFKAYNCNLNIKKWIKIIDNPEGVFDPARILFKECKYNNKVNIEEVNRIRGNLYECLRNTLLPFPGIVNFIKECSEKGLLIGLASNGTHEKAKFHLTRLNLMKYFNSIKCRDDVANKKPAPDIYKAVLEYLKIEPGEAIVFEDSPPGILAAKAANIYCVAIPNLITKYLDLKEADKIILKAKSLSLDDLISKIR
jgi:HAD superfamily hydrolase (TIGR01509 family)